MALLTLQEISDDLEITQQAVEDLRSVVSANDITLTGVLSDINSLQNPDIGIPPGIIEWFAIPHSITEIDTILSATVTGLSTSVTTLITNVATLTSDLSTEVSDRSTADIILQTNLDNLTTQVVADEASLTAEISARAALSSSLATSIATLNTRVDSVISDLSTETSDKDTDIIGINNQIATISASLQVANTKILLLQGTGVDPLGAQAAQITSLTTIANDAASDIAQEISDRQVADTAIQLIVNTVSNSISGLVIDVSNESSARIAADLAINSNLASIVTELAGHDAAIPAEISSRIAADAGLQSQITTNTFDISNNTSDIADETTDRTTADTGLQTQISSNTTAIGVNSASITNLNTLTNTIKVQFGVVKDVGGYVTDWQILDNTLGAGAFNLRYLNNDVKLQNPGYVGKYFPAVSVAAFAPANSYDTQYGSGASTLFHGTDTNDYTRLVNIYATATVGLNGSVFKGVDYTTGGDLNRLGQAITTFVVDFSGYTNGQLSVWYRIKNTPTDNTQRWFPVGMAQISFPSPRTYELASGKAVLQISVPAAQVIEFGITNLSTIDASRSTSNTVVYNAIVKVEAHNLITII